MGKVEETVDEEFDQLASDFVALEESVHRMLEGLRGYASALTGLKESRGEVVDAVGFMFRASREEDGKAGLASRNLVGGKERVSGVLDVGVQQLDAYCMAVVREYRNAFGPLKGEMKDRAKYLLDYDRFRQAVDALKEKGSPDKKIIKARESMGIAQTRYDAQNRKTIKMLRQFFNDRRIILQPVFAAFVKAEHELLSAFQMQATQTRALLDSTVAVGDDASADGESIATRSRSSTIPVNFNGVAVDNSVYAGTDASLTEQDTLLLGAVSATASPSTRKASMSVLTTTTTMTTTTTSATATATAAEPAEVAGASDERRRSWGMTEEEMEAKRGEASKRVVALQDLIDEVSINLQIFEPGSEEYADAESEVARFTRDRDAAAAEVTLMESALNGDPPPAATDGEEDGKEDGVVPSVMDTREFVVAIHDYVARREEETSFVTGDRLLVAERMSPQWYRGLNVRTDEFGMIPAHMVEPAAS